MVAVAVDEGQVGLLGQAVDGQRHGLHAGGEEVSRDRYVTDVLDREYPQYRFAQHKGYGTALHYAMLDQYGRVAVPGDEVDLAEAAAPLSFHDAAAVLAKVSRDHYVVEVLDPMYPEYQFVRHKGYGTKLHYEKIAQYGVCDIHRRTFLKKILGEQK